MGKFAILEDPKGRAVCSADLLRPHWTWLQGPHRKGEKLVPEPQSHKVLIRTFSLPLTYNTTFRRGSRGSAVSPTSSHKVPLVPSKPLPRAPSIISPLLL